MAEFQNGDGPLPKPVVPPVRPPSSPRGDQPINRLPRSEMETNQRPSFSAQDIKHLLNDQFMAGSISPQDFLDMILKAMSEKNAFITPALALTVALGDSRESTVVATGKTYHYLEIGPQNERAKSLAAAITPDHLAQLRVLTEAEQLYAERAYITAITSAPNAASPQDVSAFLRLFQGETIPTTKGEQPRERARRIYHPRRILEEIETLATVLTARPDLIDEEVRMAADGLPTVIQMAEMIIRPMFDRGVDRELILLAAAKLRAAIKPLASPE